MSVGPKARTRRLRSAASIDIMISEVLMAQIVVRNIEDSVKVRLKRRAARHGRSMEEEVRTILRDAVKRDERAGTTEGLGTAIANEFAGIGLSEEIPEWRGYPVRPLKFPK
jgi:antitoxin FitA